MTTIRAALRFRRRQLLTLALGVAWAHLWLIDRHLPSRLGPGAADLMPARIAITLVRELTPSAPAAPPPLAPRPRMRTMAAVPAPAASVPESQAALPLSEAAPVMEASIEPIPPLPTSPIAAEALPAPARQSIEWPPSTRLSYALTGDYRGPVKGQAQVEWLRSGRRYQVRMDVSVGPAFAPLLSRRVSSEGEITADGLRPHRYDEETRVALGEPRRLTIWLDSDRVRLPSGGAVPRPASVQDSASQFVQMTWLFTTQPQRLQAGQTIEFALALPRRVEPWIYEVGEPETLVTTAGPVEAVHVRPRREARPGGELLAEFWVAPSLQYLPVRILIRQGDQSYVDLLIERLPQQAEPGR